MDDDVDHSTYQIRHTCMEHCPTFPWYSSLELYESSNGKGALLVWNGNLRRDVQIEAAFAPFYVQQTFGDFLPLALKRERFFEPD